MVAMSYALRHTIRFTAVHLLARLLDLLQHRRVVDALFSLDIRGLRVEGNIIGLDACSTVFSQVRVCGGEGGG